MKSFCPITLKPKTMKKLTFERIVAYAAAAILLQTLFFKFTAHPDSVYIFTKLGLEPYGRIGLGVIELITAILLIFPRTASIGAAIGVGILAGAIFAHLTQLGIVVRNDGGSLFALAAIDFILCAYVLWVRRRSLPIVGGIFA
jgi:putative oxidoreductase